MRKTLLKICRLWCGKTFVTFKITNYIENYRFCHRTFVSYSINHAVYHFKYLHKKSKWQIHQSFESFPYYRLVMTLWRSESISSTVLDHRDKTLMRLRANSIDLSNGLCQPNRFPLSSVGPTHLGQPNESPSRTSDPCWLVSRGKMDDPLESGQKKKRISITILLNFPTQLGKGAALPQLLPGAWTGKQIHQIDFNRKTRLSFLPLGPILPHPPRQHRKPTLCVCVCARAPNRVNSRNFDWLFYLFLLLILPPNFRVGGCKPFFGPSEIIDTTAQSINEILFCGFYVFGFLHLIYLFGKDVNHSHQSKSAITAHRAI